MINILNLKKRFVGGLLSAFKFILLKPSLYLFIFFIVFSIDRHHRWEYNKDPFPGPFIYDVAEYYSFLPDAFINDKVTAIQNIKNNKRTVGMAIMYSPAFLVGTVLARIEGEQMNGYSKPYQWAIRWESIIITILGLWFCRRNLLNYFNEAVTAITLIGLFLGTNLFVYTFSFGEFPHSYLFFLFSLFVFYSIKWINGLKQRHLMIMSLIAGMIVLIRPTDALILLFPILFKVDTFTSLRDRIALCFAKPIVLIIAGLTFIIPLLVQMIIWKTMVGQFVYYSYREERFFFNDPQIINFLFSFRKGWLIYTPLMCFSLIGIILSAKRLRAFFPFLVLFLGLSIYILSSWWEWSFGGSFGCRPLIESYALLSFPLALFINWVWELFSFKKVLNYMSRITIIVVVFVLIKLNLFQSWQYRWGIIHWSGMNKSAYKFVFLRDRLEKEELDYLYKIITPPEADKMIKGQRD